MTCPYAEITAKLDAEINVARDVALLLREQGATSAAAAVERVCNRLAVVDTMAVPYIMEDCYM